MRPEPHRVPTEEPDRGPSKLWLSIGLSLAFHVLFLAASSDFWVLPPSTSSTAVGQSPPERVLRVRFREPAKSESSTAFDPNGQIVDLMDSAKSDPTPPKNSAFLSDKNRSVDRETQAQYTGPRPTGPIGKPGSPGKPSTPETGKSAKFGLEEKSPLQKFLSDPGSGNSGSGDTASIAPSNYLPSIAFGEQTMLNTSEFRFTSYYIRLKRQIEPVWNPRRALQYDQAARKQYVTEVNVTLNGMGYVKEVLVTKSSGNAALDDEAVRAIHEGGPYLNPPQGMAEEDGNIRLRNFYFIVTRSSLF